MLERTLQWSKCLGGREIDREMEREMVSEMEREIGRSEREDIAKHHTQSTYFLCLISFLF